MSLDPAEVLLRRSQGAPEMHVMAAADGLVRHLVAITADPLAEDSPVLVPRVHGERDREFATPPQELADVLAFCDMTTSPDGEHVQVHNRLAEIHDRYGSGHLVSRFISRATPLIPEAVGHVHARTAVSTSYGRSTAGPHQVDKATS